MAVTASQVQDATLEVPAAMPLPLSRLHIEQIVSLLGTPAPETQVPSRYTAGCLAFQGGTYTAAVRLHLQDGRTVDVAQVEICYPDPDVSDSDITIIAPYPFGTAQTYASPALAHLLARLVASG